MPDKIPEISSPEPAAPAAAPDRRPRCTKAQPGRQGSGWVRPAALASTAVADSAHAPNAAPRPAQCQGSASPQGPAANPLARKAKPTPAKAQKPLLSLEDTIAAGTALMALRGQFTIVHVEIADPDRIDHSLSGMAADLLPGPSSIRKASDATEAVLELLEAASKALTASGGLVSRSIVHWGTAENVFTLKPSTW